MSTPERRKCAVVDRQVEPCDTLVSTIEMSGRGMRRLAWTNMDTGDISRTFIVLHSGDWRKNGIILNRCPFCGGDLSSHVESSES